MLNKRFLFDPNKECKEFDSNCLSPRKGKLGDNGCYVNSVHDDLDGFFDKIRERFEHEEIVSTYAFPKLTKHEMIQVEVKNKDVLKTFFKYHLGANPDVPVEQMKASESKSKFSMIACSRHTFRLRLESDMARYPSTESDAISIRNPLLKKAQQNHLI